MDNKPSIKISDSILTTSSNLLGLCFLILSLVKINGLGAATRLDEFLVLPILLFFSAGIFSYLALRKRGEAVHFENIADKVFICGLVSVTLISLIFIFEVVI